MRTSSLRLAVISCCLLATVLLSSDRARGFSYFNVGGQVVVWTEGLSVRYLSPTSFGEGTEFYTLLLAGMGLWNLSPGSSFEYYYDPNGLDQIDPYDGYNDTIAADLDPGVRGVTYMVNQGAAWFDMDQVYSPFPDNVGWNAETNPDCETASNPDIYGFSFLLVCTHELGHALGLGHDPIGDEPPGTPWFIATMNPSYPAGGGFGQANIVELHTDDRRGCRFLYPGTDTLVDLGNANFCAAGGPRLGKAGPIFFEPQTITSGADLTVWSVIENLGTVAVSNVRQGFYLSTDDVIDTGDLLIGDTRWSIAVGDGYEFSADITMPDLVPGTYYVGSILDDLDELAEDYEDNNDVRYCGELTLAAGVPTFGPFTQIVTTCAEPFVGPTPVVDYPINTAPITWSIDNPQPGMTIDPATGVIAWPTPVASPFEYEIVVRATNSAGSFSQTLDLGVLKAAPAITPIADDEVDCRGAYQGPIPVLTAPTCMSPITHWTLLAGPDGMTINPTTGRVTWLATPPVEESYTVVIQATNDIGVGTEDWELTVISDGGDLDQNGTINTADIAPFITVLLGGSPGSGFDASQADMTCDEIVNGLDIQPFIEMLLLRPPAPGACCFSDGTCQQVSGEECYILGGTFRGDGSNCQIVDCEGACCFYTGGCLDFTQDNCAIAGGTFQGMGTLCVEVGCPPSGQGACCLPDETCILTTSALCAGQGGTYKGTGKSCEAVDCAIPLGACCHGDGTCSIGSDDYCTTAGGVYMGDDTTCASISCDGACCFPSGACLALSQPNCAVAGGSFQGPGTECVSTACPIEPQGACCNDDETCTIQTGAVCAIIGGSYQGDNTDCATVDCSAAARGACCLPDETCVEVTQAACLLQGGAFFGAGTDCSGVDCVLTDVGACYNPVDWTCQETSAAICDALGGSYEGDNTTCAGTSAPEYRNDATSITTYYNPGANSAMGDDMQLAGTARGLVYYDIAVYGGNSGGGTFDVTVSLYNACPGAGGTLIADTTATWEDVPDDDFIYTLSATFDPPIALPDTVWMVATFSTQLAGWVVMDEAEVGFTDDIYGENDPPWGCTFAFGGANPPYSGFGANINCVDIPEPEGACCHPDESCTEGTVSACNTSGGLFMGADTTCAGVSCVGLDVGACCDVVNWTRSILSESECDAAGGIYDGNGSSCFEACPEYENVINPITLSYNPAQPMADDITFGGSARGLEYYEIAVYGGGGGPFDIAAVFYDGSPCAGGQEIPGTLVTGSGLPDNGQVLPLTVHFPSVTMLPENPWLVVEFSTAAAGWIVAEEAEVGSTASTFALATFDEGSQQFIWSCSETIGDPPDTTFGGFWTRLQCVQSSAKAGGTANVAAPYIVYTPAGDKHAAPQVVRPISITPGEQSPLMLLGGNGNID